MFLEINQVTKKYNSKKRGTKVALAGIDLSLAEGEILALLGVNGAGKTTLSSIIASLHPPTSGDVLFQGKSIYTNLYSYRKKVGFCPQKPNLDRSFTISENLIFSGQLFGMTTREAKKRKDELINQFELLEYQDDVVDILSGGYKQRFLLARTLMHRPSLVILDEPTVGLDPHIRRNIWTIIRRLKKEGVSVLLTTHYLDEAEALSDRVCIIDQGRVRLIDTTANLKEHYKKGTLEDIFLTLIEEARDPQ
jgi:ABC-2 type transport system ATP-binding protein